LIKVPLDRRRRGNKRRKIPNQTAANAINRPDNQAGNRINTQVNVGRETVKKALDTFGKEAEATTALEDEAAAYKIVGTDSVGPVAGAASQSSRYRHAFGNGRYFAFYRFRYDWTYAAGAVIAVFHDVLITLAFFSFFSGKSA
jgi:preprotein translocase subunit SecF